MCIRDRSIPQQPFFSYDGVSRDDFIGIFGYRQLTTCKTGYSASIYFGGCGKRFLIAVGIVVNNEVYALRYVLSEKGGLFSIFHTILLYVQFILWFYSQYPFISQIGLCLLYTSRCV